MSGKNIAMLAIDPQYDFYDIPVDQQYISTINHNEQPIRTAPALPVTGSWRDAERLHHFLCRNLAKINSITVTMDSHQCYDIAHPSYWHDQNGNHPQPFTQISHDDIVNGKWRPVDSQMQQHVINYTMALETSGKYQLVIWPPHCLIGEVGQTVVQPIMSAIKLWEKNHNKHHQAIHKGENPHTEHYGGCEAEYPLDDDLRTHFDSRLITLVKQNDMVIITGQALSHCVASTVRQMVEHLPKSERQKMVLLSDTSSPVSGFETQGDVFIKEMIELGVQVTTTSQVTL